MRNPNKPPIHTQEIQTLEQFSTIDSQRIEVLEDTPDKIVRLTDFENLGFTDITPEQARAMMSEAAEEMARLRGYGLDTPYIAHRVEVVEREGERIDALMTVNKRVHGETIDEHSIGKDIRQAALDATMRYFTDSIQDDQEGEPMLWDIRPQNIMWGHTVDDSNDRLIMFDTDPFFEIENETKATFIAENLKRYWRSFADHFQLDDALLSQTEKLADQSFISFNDLEDALTKLK